MWFSNEGSESPYLVEDALAVAACLDARPQGDMAALEDLCHLGSDTSVRVEVVEGLIPRGGDSHGGDSEVVLVIVARGCRSCLSSNNSMKLSSHVRLTRRRNKKRHYYRRLLLR